MLGLLGFILLAVVIGIYAYTSNLYYALVPSREKQLFVGGFSLLATASMLWACSFLVPSNVLPQLIFVSDVILVAATGCMVAIVLNLGRPVQLISVTLVGAALLAVRAFMVPSTAYISDGLLIFNLQPVTALVVGLVFLLAWLPAVIRVARLAFRSSQTLRFRDTVGFIFTSAILMTSFFLTARRPVMIVLTFVFVILMFVVLIGVNALLQRIETTSKKGGARG